MMNSRSGRAKEQSLSTLDSDSRLCSPDLVAAVSIFGSQWMKGSLRIADC